MNVMVFLIKTNTSYTGTWAVQEMYTSTLLCDSFTVYIIASDHDILMAVLDYFHAVHHMILVLPEKPFGGNIPFYDMQCVIMRLKHVIPVMLTLLLFY